MAFTLKTKTPPIMKRTMLLLALAMFTTQLFAQDDEDNKAFKFGLGGTLSVPLGNLKESTTYGVGFEALGVYSLSTNIALFAQAGVNVFKGKSTYGDAGSILNIPLLGGVRFKSDGFFVGAGVGYGKFNVSGGEALSGIMYSPQIGYDLGNYQLLLHYSSTAVTGGNLSYVGLKFFRTF